MAAVQLCQRAVGRGPVRVVEAQGVALGVQVRVEDLGPLADRRDVGGRAVPGQARLSPGASAAAATAAASFFFSVMSLRPEARSRNRVALHVRRAA